MGEVSFLGDILENPFYCTIRSAFCFGFFEFYLVMIGLGGFVFEFYFINDRGKGYSI